MVFLRKARVASFVGLTKQCSVHTREYRPRENVTFLENGTKVYALNPKTFVYVPEKSAGDPEVDIIRTINIPFVVRQFACIEQYVLVFLWLF